MAIAIVGIVVSLVYGAFAGTAESKDEIEEGNDIYHEARWSLDKLETDLSTAYISKNQKSNSLFYGVTRDGPNGLPADELHFTSFSHVKFNPTAHESDECELSYLVMENPDNGLWTLYRREDPTPDEDNMDGGEIYELAQDVLAFNLRYYDGEMWVDDWDSRSYADEETTETEVEQYDEMINNLPMAVEVTVILAGPRETEIAFHTKIRIILSSIDLTMIDELEAEEGGTEETGGVGKPLESGTGSTGGKQ